MSELDRKEAGSKNLKKNIASCKKKPPQVWPNELSKIRAGAVPKVLAYSFSSLRNKVEKNLSWQESEWPELPKLDLPLSQTGSRRKDQSQASSSFSPCRSELEEGNERQNKIESNEENHEKIICSKVQNVCDLVHNTPKILSHGCSAYVGEEHILPCSSKALESVTCNFSALNVSKTCQQFCHDEAPVEGQSLISEKPQPFQNQTMVQVKRQALQRQPSKNKTEDGSSKFERQKNCFLQDSDKTLLKEDDFPDLLSNNKTRRKVKFTLLPEEELSMSAKKQARRYPKKHDPICINLGAFLENLSSNPTESKTIMRSRYLKEIRPSTAKPDPSRRVIKRGKQREFPKRKILSKLKLAILKGRHQRQQMRLLSSTKSLIRCEDASDLCFEENLKTLSSATISGDLNYHDDPPKVSCENPKNDGCLSTNLNDECKKDFPGYSSTLGATAGLEPGISALVAKENSEEVESMETKLSQLMRRYADPVPCSREVLLEAKSSIHSRNFREYCSNDNSALLEEKAKAFVKQIYRYQTKSHSRDAEKARIHRRYALGLREADKFLKLRKLKVLIIARDLEVSLEKGGLDDAIENIKERASKENLPVIFSLKRRDLAYCVFRKVPVSCMAVLNYEGAEEPYRAMIEAWREATLSYERKLREKIESISQQIILNEKGNDSSLGNNFSPEASISVFTSSHLELQGGDNLQDNVPVSSVNTGTLADQTDTE